MFSGLRLLLDLYALLLGLITGSFLNVVIYRLPRGLSSVLPRSRCPSCREPIRALDNLPVLSWLLLRGRCRRCGAPISPRYPLIEALTAALFVLSAERFAFSAGSAVAALFCCLMIILAVIDLEHLWLPDKITLPGLLAGVAVQAFLPVTRETPWPGPVGAVVGAVTGAVILLAAYGGWWLVRREEGLGLGDVKMLALIGAFLGWRGVVVSLLLGAFAGAFLGLTMMAVGRGGMKSQLPFGTFLAVGGVVALFFGPPLISLYLGTAFGPLGLAGPIGLLAMR
jgi:leader peptidase (prepilin peptidase)/N-methyltransferase